VVGKGIILFIRTEGIWWIFLKLYYDNYIYKNGGDFVDFSKVLLFTRIIFPKFFQHFHFSLIFFIYKNRGDLVDFSKRILFTKILFHRFQRFHFSFTIIFIRTEGIWWIFLKLYYDNYIYKNGGDLLDFSKVILFTRIIFPKFFHFSLTNLYL